MKIGIVSNLKSVEHIKKAIVTRQIQNVEILYYDYSEYVSALDYVRKAQKEVDALLFGGKAIYNFAFNEIKPTIPWEFIDRKSDSFLKGFVYAMQKGQSISKITIDSCDKERFNNLEVTYSDIGIEDPLIINLDLELEDSDYLSDKYIERLCDLHKYYYVNNYVNCCFTCYDNIFEQLEKENIPIFLFDFTIDEIAYKIKTLQLMHSYNELNINEITIISISIDDFNNESLTGFRGYNLDIDKINITKHIYTFADKLQGVVEANSSLDEFTIYTTKSNLYTTTENLTEFSLLDEVRRKSVHTISVGVGIGGNPRHSKYNSLLTLNKSKAVGGDCIYFKHNEDRIIGPINATRNVSSEIYINSKVEDIADKTNISNKDILLLMKYKKQYSLDVTTSKELSEIYGYSLRRINDMVSKLELAGYVKVVGTKMLNNVGRPHRLIKLLI